MGRDNASWSAYFTASSAITTVLLKYPVGDSWLYIIQSRPDRLVCSLLICTCGSVLVIHDVYGVICVKKNFTVSLPLQEPYQSYQSTICTANIPYSGLLQRTSVDTAHPAALGLPFVICLSTLFVYLPLFVINKCNDRDLSPTQLMHGLSKIRRF